MEDNTSGLLDLDSLSIRLSDVANELEKAQDMENIKKLASQVLDLLKHRNEYYYQFSHGGAATGFNFFSADLINTSTRLLALIGADSKTETIFEHRNKLIDDIRKVIQTLDSDSKFRVPNIPVLEFLKPPSWTNPGTYFVSYSHRDQVSKSIIPLIRSRIGSSVYLWIDEYELKRHQQIPKEISDAIKKSDATILIPSRNFFESKWCNEEWQALFMKRLLEPEYRMYLIRIDNEQYPPLLDAFNYTDCRNFPEPKAQVELGKLLREIEDYETYNRFRRRERVR